MNSKKTYLFTFSQKTIHWDSIFESTYRRVEQQMPNLQKAMTIGVDTEFRKLLTAGTKAEGWHFTHIQMALEAIFVTKFFKESPGKHDRISLENLRKELNTEFESLHCL